MQAPLASRDAVQDVKDQVHTIAVWNEVPKPCRLGWLFRPVSVEILARYSYRAAVFSLPERKIHSVKLLPFKDERLYLHRATGSVKVKSAASGLVRRFGVAISAGWFFRAPGRAGEAAVRAYGNRKTRSCSMRGRKGMDYGASGWHYAGLGRERA